jgi:hypothetical protein
MTAQDICTKASKGNPDALRFCAAWCQFCRVVDDWADRDRERTLEDVCARLMTFVIEVAGNPFFCAHKAQLIGLMIQSVNAWLDSENSAGAKRDVLKGFYHEVVYHVAFITGGWEALRELTAQAREYKEGNQ